MKTVPWINDTMQGIMKTYYDSGMVVSAEFPYKNGIKDGLEKHNYKNGKEWYEAPYVAGKRNGTGLTYFPSGAKHIITPYSNDLETDTVRIFSEDGKLSEKAAYKNGKKDGIDYTYYFDGALQFAMPFVNGIETGVQKCYDEQGRLWNEILYKDGTKNGDSKWYFQDGKLRLIITYDHDKEINKRRFDENGLEFPGGN